MPKEVQDIDELEALLDGLDESDLAALEELDAAPAPVAAPAKPVRKRNLKPLKDEEAPAEAPIKQAVVEDEDLEAALSELDEAAPVSAPVNSPAVKSAQELEAFALQVIELIGTVGAKFGFSEEEAAIISAPVVAKIDADSDIGKIELDLARIFKARKDQDELADVPFDEEEIKPATAGKTVEDVTDEELNALVELVDETDKLIEQTAAKRIETLDPEKLVSLEEMEAKVSADPELDALLAGVEAAPTPKPVVTAPVKPVAVTATKKAGALNTFIDADQLQRDLHFTEATINDGMTRQAALFAHYARLSADATYQSDRAKQQVDLLEAQLNQRFRDAMIAAGTKFTEKSIDAMVIQDSSYQAAQERAHEAKAIASMVASAADSFRHRKDMLIQVGADLRLEKQGELRMKEHAGERALAQLEK